MTRALSYPFRCSWCGIEFGQTTMQGSHGMCPACQNQMLELPELSAEDLSALPYGVVHLTREGMILSYSPAEERLSRRSAADVVGLNFFHDVAPCTAVKEFEGRFGSFLASEHEPEQFSFVFAFPHGRVAVTVAFVRAGGQGALVLVNASQSTSVSAA